MNHRAASANPRRNGRAQNAPKMGALALPICSALGTSSAFAGPEGGQIVSGAGSITQSGGSTVVTQGTERLGVDWRSFNVGETESVRFDQPSSSSVALNRIFD